MFTDVFKRFHAPVTIVLLIATLAGMMPQAVYAQNVATPGTAEWYQQEVAKTQTVFAAEMNRAQTETETTNQNQTVPQAQASQAVQLATPESVHGFGCSYVSLTDEQDPPMGSENVEKVQSTDQDKAAQGGVFYRGKANGYQRLVAWQQWGLPDNTITFWMLAVKSAKATKISISEIKPDGTPGQQWVKNIPASNQWQILAERTNPKNLGVSVNTDRDSNVPAIKLDALAVIACDPSDVHLPFITTGARSQQPLDCGPDKNGRWRIGSESNDQIASSLYQLPGTVTDHPSNNQYACWNKIQKHAKNWSTNQTLDFLDKDRVLAAALWLVPVALAGENTIPFWGTSVAASVGGEAAILVGEFLVAVAPWAVLLGIAILIMWWGWQAFITASTVEYLNPLRSFTFTGAHGKKTTFHSQYFSDPKDLLDGTATYSMYRLEDMVKDGVYESWVQAEKIVSYLAVNEASTKGFIISSQDESHKLVSASYLFKVIDRTAELIGEEEEDVWETDHPSGPIKPEDIAAIATAIALALAADVADAPDEPDDRCLSKITAERVGFDIEQLDPGVSKEVLDEMLILLADPVRHKIRYQKPQIVRGPGSAANISYNGHYFPDGSVHSNLYVCVKTVMGRGLWTYNKTLKLEMYFSNEWAD